jgi:N utilization substance protein B
LAEIHEITPTGERRRAREYALQILFQMDLSPAPLEEALEEFWRGKSLKPQVAEFAGRLARGTHENRERIDGVLTSISHHWRVERMAVVDRNILRVALYEMFYETSTPRVVVINEAIEVAKKFGDEESGPFINGILDAVRLRLERNELKVPARGSEGSQPPLRTPA